MQVRNNMGGILFASYLFTDEIQLFSVITSNAILQKQKGHDWRILPTIQMGAIPTVTPEESEAGTRYKHSATIHLLRAVISDSELKIIRTINTRGCILMYQDCNGFKRILGTKDHPLFGTITEVPGSKPTDTPGYNLNLSGISTHPQLPFIEL